MRDAVRTFWLGLRLNRRRAAALAALVSLLTVFTAPLWHDHSHDHHPHEDVCEHDHDHDSDQSPGHHEDDCPVCVAVEAPTGDGLPDLPLLQPPPAGGFARWVGSERWAVLWAGRDRASRGPPLDVV